MSNARLHFRIEPEETGWPPIAVETLNGELQADGLIKVDNTPFFVWGVAAGDIVEATAVPERNGEFFFEKVEVESPNKALSIILKSSEIADSIYEFFKDLQCYCEYGEFGRTRMLAVCIGDDKDYNFIKKKLDAEEGLGKLSYAELCI